MKYGYGFGSKIFTKSNIIVLCLLLQNIPVSIYRHSSHSRPGFNSRGREFTRGQGKLKCVEGPSSKNIYGHLFLFCFFLF